MKRVSQEECKVSLKIEKWYSFWKKDITGKTRDNYKTQLNNFFEYIIQISVLLEKTLDESLRKCFLDEIAKINQMSEDDFLSFLFPEDDRLEDIENLSKIEAFLRKEGYRNIGEVVKGEYLNILSANGIYSFDSFFKQQESLTEKILDNFDESSINKSFYDIIDDIATQWYYSQPEELYRYVTYQDIPEDLLVRLDAEISKLENSIDSDEEMLFSMYYSDDPRDLEDSLYVDENIKDQLEMLRNQGKDNEDYPFLLPEKYLENLVISINPEHYKNEFETIINYQSESSEDIPIYLIRCINCGKDPQDLYENLCRKCLQNQVFDGENISINQDHYTNLLTNTNEFYIKSKKKGKTFCACINCGVFYERSEMKTAREFKNKRIKFPINYIFKSVQTKKNKQLAHSLCPNCHPVFLKFDKYINSLDKKERLDKVMTYWDNEIFSRFGFNNELDNKID